MSAAVENFEHKIAVLTTHKHDKQLVNCSARQNYSVT